MQNTFAVDLFFYQIKKIELLLKKVDLFYIQDVASETGFLQSVLQIIKRNFSARTVRFLCDQSLLNHSV